MIAVIFEVWPSQEGRAHYLQLAAQLRPLLDEVDGFISIERFGSLSDPGKLLSLSFFRDEAAQCAGRQGVFDDYRLRIAGVVRDYGMADREQAPADSRCRHDLNA